MFILYHYEIRKSFTLLKGLIYEAILMETGWCNVISNAWSNNLWSNAAQCMHNYYAIYLEMRSSALYYSFIFFSSLACLDMVEIFKHLKIYNPATQWYLTDLSAKQDLAVDIISSCCWISPTMECKESGQSRSTIEQFRPGITCQEKLLR